MKKYMVSLRKRIEYEKWIEGIRIKRDPGVDFIYSWIQLNAAHFRKLWEESQCKICKSWEVCGYEVTKSCNNFNAIE